MTQTKQLCSTAITLPDSLEAVNDYFYSRGYTDGLPIVSPTKERIEAMIEAAGRNGNEIIAKLPPTFGQATVEKVAINAVMAGCEPSYMPAIIAAIEAMADERFPLQTIQSTTNPGGPMLIINGPIRHRLKVNCSSNALGPGQKANATIGRVIRLLLVNIGGAKPGLVDKATQGMPGKYTFCFGEHEEESPWEPLHVERGFALDQSAVTVVDALGTHNIHAGNATTEDLVRLITACMLDLGSNNFFTGGGEAVLLLCPTHARILSEGGYTKEQLREHFYLHVRAPLEKFPKNYRERIIERRTIIDGKVPLVDRPELMMIVIVGGPGGLHSTFVPTMAYGSVTKAIRNTHT